MVIVWDASQKRSVELGCAKTTEILFSKNYDESAGVVKSSSGFHPVLFLFFLYLKLNLTTHFNKAPY